ncbi:YbjN domain-containing protein [Alphaproteobacteria bacterium KMM 3653]|uniref:YbjN domain-containing protein n=1 Tax=Harenicola maris TaxID=2841044 RepID=A0AAP2CSU8_9RHOB|nr:YbjN domain-containing protein [Harenicola maris]
MRLVLALLSALWVAPAAAQTLSASDPAGIAEAMRRAGFEVAQTQSNAGAPALVAVHSQIKFQVFFLGCEDGANCAHLLLTSEYATPEPVTPEQVNAWMTDNALGSVSYDAESGNSRVRYFLTTTGGVNERMFSETMYLWRLANISWLRAIAPAAE